jgi:hypothetical protein
LLATGAGITLIEPQFANGTTELKGVNIEQQTGMSQPRFAYWASRWVKLTLKDLAVGVLVLHPG